MIRQVDQRAPFLIGIMVGLIICIVAHQLTIPKHVKQTIIRTTERAMPKQPINAPSKEIPINEQIATVQKRLLRIENSYPRKVMEHEITKERAANEIDRYRAVLATLIRAKEREPLRTVTDQAPYVVSDGKN